MGSDTWMLGPTMINVARVSMNRIDAKPTVTSGLDLARPRLADHAEQPDRARPAVHQRHRLLHPRRRAAAVRHARQQRLRRHRRSDAGSPARHSIKFGGELRRDQISSSFINRPNGNFTFNGAVHRQRRRRLPARLPAAVPPGDRRPEHGRLVVGVRASTGRTSSGVVARHAERRPALRGERSRSSEAQDN